MEGWIKLHRQMLNWQWYDDANVMRLFIHLLLSANREKAVWRGIEINRGQVFTSVLHLAQKLKISIKETRTALSKLTKTKEIDVQGASNGTMITICKYDSYQLVLETEGQAKGQTRGKRGATNKKDKNSDINISLWRDDFNVYLAECKEAFRQYYTDENFIKTQQALNPNVNVKLSITKGYENFWKTEAGWKHKKKSKTEQIDWKRTIINAIEMNRVYYTKQEIAEINNR